MRTTLLGAEIAPNAVHTHTHIHASTPPVDLPQWPAEGVILASLLFELLGALVQHHKLVTTALYWGSLCSSLDMQEKNQFENKLDCAKFTRERIQVQASAERHKTFHAICISFPKALLTDDWDEAKLMFHNALNFVSNLPVDMR